VKTIYSVNGRRFQHKPSAKQAKQINSQFTGVNQSLNDLMNAIEQGQTFTCPVFLNNYRGTEAFIAQQIFGVDFDKGMTVEQATAILEDYGLGYTFGYYTFSHSDSSPRFRLIFVLDGEIHDKQLVSDINHALHKFFDKKSDASCTDIPRMWYGSNRPCFPGSYIDKPINLLEFLECINFKNYAKDGNQFRSCIDVNDIEVKKCENSGIPIIYNYRISHFSTKEFHTSIPNDEAPEVEKWEVEDLLHIEIFRRFYEGGASGKPDKLSHNELFGLATNLNPLRGGKKLFKDLLKKNKNYNRDKKNIISYVKNREYRPQHLKGFSPFECDINSPHQTFPQILRKKGRITAYEPPVLLPLVEAERKLADAFERVMTSCDNKIFLIKCAPGIGKTEYVKNLKNVVLAFPDHALKEEQFETSSLLPNDKLSTPHLKNKLSSVLSNYFEALYAIDLPKNVIMELRRLSEGETVCMGQTEADVEAAKGYFKLLEEIDSAGDTKTIFTTHTRALQTEWLHDTIIFDEDPLKNIIVQHTASVSELRQLAEQLFRRRIDMNGLLSLLNVDDFEQPKRTPGFSVDSKLVYEICVKQHFKSHVVNFFNSECYFIDKGHVNYSVNNTKRFFSHKKYLICDATASVETYKQLFPDRLEVIDISNVKNVGIINQYTNYACSKYYFDESFSKLKIDQSKPTITFKDEKYRFQNATPDIHFGRVRGSNVLNGQDINVVGTYHYQPNYYRFIAYAIKIENGDWKLRPQEVQNDGREFNFRTFDHPILQRIHLQTVEGELVQAVHRARILRRNATVTLYSNFPLLQADYIY
jgi:hypothetical protein